MTLTRIFDTGSGHVRKGSLVKVGSLFGSVSKVYTNFETAVINCVSIEQILVKLSYSPSSYTKAYMKTCHLETTMRFLLLPGPPTPFDRSCALDVAYNNTIYNNTIYSIYTIAI